MNNSVRPLYHQSTVSKQTKILMQVRRVLTFSLTIKQNSHLLPPVQKCTKQSSDFFYFLSGSQVIKILSGEKEKNCQEAIFFSKKELSHSIVRLSLNVFRWTLNDTPY